MSPLLTGQEVWAAGVPWGSRCVHSLPPTPRTHRITITNFCLGKHLVSEGDLLKDQRGSPAYISPDVLSGRCGAQAVGPGQHTARRQSSSLLPYTLSVGFLVASGSAVLGASRRRKTAAATPVHI